MLFCCFSLPFFVGVCVCVLINPTRGFNKKSPSSYSAPWELEYEKFSFFCYSFLSAVFSFSHATKRFSNCSKKWRQNLIKLSIIAFLIHFFCSTLCWLAKFIFKPSLAYLFFDFSGFLLFHFKCLRNNLKKGFSRYKYLVKFVGGKN